MFGRSGQMFPRQRAFHDAIYEEEYGSESEDDCCRSRGLSAILCWFLSVIILIGLAASVVLTVFFILKSRSYLGKGMSQDEELFDFQVPNQANYEIPLTTQSTTTTTTLRPYQNRILTTRRFQPPTTFNSIHHDNNKNWGTTTTEGPSMFKVLLDTIKKQYETPKRDSDELGGEESSERGVSLSPSTTTKRPTTASTPPPQQVLFTLAASTPTQSTTKRTSLRTSFSSTSSTEDSSRAAPNYKLYEKDHESRFIKEAETTTEKPEVDFQFGESQVKKTLSNQVPSHPDFELTTQPPTSASTTADDLLTRIIKTLQPKWNRTRNPPPNDGTKRNNLTGRERIRPTYKTPEPNGEKTYFPPPTRGDVTNRLVRTRGSTNNNNGDSEPNRGRYRTTTDRTVVIVTPEKSDEDLEDHQHSDENFGRREKEKRKNPIEIISPPDLTHRDRDWDESKEIIDVLVGNDDKTLFTKEVDGTVMTSAIVPPWFEPSNQTKKSEKEKMMSEIMDKQANVDAEDEKENSQYNSQGIDALISLFSNSPLPKSPTEVDVASRKIDQHQNFTGTKGEAEEFQELIKELSPDFPTTSTKKPSGKVEDVGAASESFHYGTKDGTTHIYGFYPDEDFEGDNESRESNSPDDPHDHNDKDPSHVIELAYDSYNTQPAEIIIDDHDDHTHPHHHILTHMPHHDEGTSGEFDEDFHQTPAQPDPTLDEFSSYYPALPDNDALTSDSFLRPTLALPPPFENDDPFINLHSGGGIRHPMSQNDRRTQIYSTKDLSMAENEPKPHVVTSRPPEEKLQISPSDPDFNKMSGEEKDQIPETSEVGEYEDNHTNNRDEEFDKNDNHSGKEDSKGNPGNVKNQENSSDGLVERRPIISLDEGLYPDQRHTFYPYSEETERSEEPEDKVHQIFAVTFTTQPTTSVPGLDVVAPPPTSPNKESDEEKVSDAGFIPPQPINFHENTFALQKFPEKDGWRPVVTYEKNVNSNDNPQRLAPIPIQHLKNGKNEKNLVAPNLSFHAKLRTLSTSPLPSNPPPPRTTESFEVGDSNENVNYWSTISSLPVKKLPIRPSAQFAPPPPHHQQHQQLQHPHHRVKFPHHPNMKVPPRAGQRVDLIGQATNQNSERIDRGKYAYRPAIPPIVMRRQPHQNVPFIPNRQRKTNPVFVNQGFGEQGAQTQRAIIFETHPPRQSGRGTVKWPMEDENNNGQFYNPNRRNG